MIWTGFNLDRTWQTNKLWNHIAYASVLLICFNGISLTRSDGNIGEWFDSTIRLFRMSAFHTCFFCVLGCLFATDVCIPEVEWCFDGKQMTVFGVMVGAQSNDIIMSFSDLSFGKCLSSANGLVGDDAMREPLSEEAAQTLALMLEELRGAGLGWNHPFVQCRMQSALYSLRQNVPMPNNVCADEIPTRDDVVWFQDPSAVINFAPPNNDYADEVYVPPMKKGFAIEQPHSIEQVVFGHRDRPILFDDGENDANDNDADLESRMQDVKNRIELRKMLAEYTSGALKPPIYLKDDIIDRDDVYYGDDAAPGDEGDRYQLSTEDRPQKRPEPDEPESPLNSLFRENKMPPKYPVGIDANDEFDRSNNDPSAIQYKSIKANQAPAESGVYTEGGLVLVPDARDAKECKYFDRRFAIAALIFEFEFPDERETEARNLLANMLGFTRHERLDVKKPGPPASPPATDLKTNEVPIALVKPNRTLETHAGPNVRSERLQKIKKVSHFDDDHAPHSVDTDYAHVYLKTS